MPPARWTSPVCTRIAVGGAGATSARSWRPAVGVDLGLAATAAAANGHHALPGDYIEPIAAFLDATDEPARYLFPELLPEGVIMLVHGEPRARKSLAAFELALAGATGSAPFGLPRFEPAEAFGVLYVQEEDP